jgi:hypothetical protein
MRTRQSLRNSKLRENDEVLLDQWREGEKETNKKPGSIRAGLTS